MNQRKSLFPFRQQLRDLPMNRITLIMGIGFFVAFIIFTRLFYLQVIKANYYNQIALEKNYGYSEIAARRGEIFIQDRNSDEPYALATNTTLKLVYADPTLIENPTYVGEILAPLLFDLEEEKERDEKRYETLLEEYKSLLNLDVVEETAGFEETTEETTDEAIAEENEEDGLDESTIDEPSTDTEGETEEDTPPPPPTAEEIEARLVATYEDLVLHTDEELFALYQQELIDTLSQKTRSVILLMEDVEPYIQASVSSLNLPGIDVTENGNIYAYPDQIPDKGTIAKKLSPVLSWDREHLESVLVGKNRYVILKRKLDFAVSDEIERLMDEDTEFFGIGTEKEYYRHYPEGQLAAQILGYVSSWGEGQYGIEKSFENELHGVSGYFISSKDGSGNQITVGDSEFQEAINGSNIGLTIDRAIQAKAEEVIAAGVEEFQADSGTILVQEPSTGKILAMAHYPTFDPNEYGDVYELEKIEISPEEEEYLYRVGEGENERIYLYIQPEINYRIEIFYDEETDEYYKYANNVGPEVYQAKSVTLPWEPGSIFKPIAMAAAIDAGEVTPHTTFSSSGPVEVDEFTIETFNGQYYGESTMTDVLINSDNTGMVFVAYKLGRALLYDYLSAFGFAEKSHIEFDGEHSGQMEYYDFWADSELVTKSFGQGITVTPVQMITSISALANGGLLMQPYIVQSIEDHDGNVQTFDPQVVRRVITEETSDQITAMMTAVVENGAPLAAMEDYYIAGKTGTAQTYQWGKALDGRGTTIASFVGFAPIDDPQFTVLVKLDHPKTVEWGAATAAPTFHKLAEFLVHYYNLEPDKDLSS